MPERNNYEVYMETKVPEGIDVKGDFETPFYEDVYGVEDLDKNESEFESIKSALTAINEVLSELGTCSFNVDPARIHIISEDEFEKKIDSNEKMQGAQYYGHVYLKRGTDEKIFIRDLTHELAHMVSFYQLGVSFKTDPESSKTQGHLRMRHTGLRFSPKDKPNSFEGLNEAATEVFAYRVRHKISKDIGNRLAYLPHTLLMRTLFQFMSDSYASADNAENALLRDYVEGGYDFLKRLETKKPGSVKILREMGITDDDALDAAQKLKFDDLATRIKNYIDRNTKPAE